MSARTQAFLAWTLTCTPLSACMIDTSPGTGPSPADGGGAPPDGEDPVVDAVPGIQQLTLLHDGIERRFDVALPDTIATSTDAAVLVVLHGAGGNGTNFRTSRRALVQRGSGDGWILVFPTATVSSITMNTRWNYTADPDDADDEAFVLEVIDVVTSSLGLASSPAYVTGFSNGARFTHQLLARHPEVFAAGAPIGGGIGVREVDGTDIGLTEVPTTPRPILMANGSNDPAVPWEGGASEGGDAASVAEAYERWVVANGCDDESVRETFTESDGYIDRWQAGCNDGAEVIQVRYQTGQHIWPDPNDVPNWDASNAVLDFFASH